MGMTLAVALGLVVTAAIPVVQLHRQDGLQPYDAPFGRVLAKSLLVAAIGLGLGLTINLLPGVLHLPLLVPLLLATLWCSARFALGPADRQALGKTGKALRLT